MARPAPGPRLGLQGQRHRPSAHSRHVQRAVPQRHLQQRDRRQHRRQLHRSLLPAHGFELRGGGPQGDGRGPALRPLRRGRPPTCAYWPVKSTATDQPLHAEGAPPIVVVGTTRDPATPYKWAQALASQLSSGVLISYDGDGHTAYRMGSSCVDQLVDRYLISRTAPKADVSCPKT
ncbi:alpha/beta hydrolase [Streptosporangium lutulentum]